MSLPEVTRTISNLPFQSTDCAQPMLYALKKGLEVDAFVIYTDNDTWAGKIHPMEALKRYRKETGINAKLVVAGMTSTGFSIADPKDTGSLDIVGFDSSAVSVMGDFVRS
jgi:60 kDa SS-A/Ro ribonucleoprotein